MYIDPNRRGTPRFSKLSGVAEDCARVAQHLSHQKLMQIHLAFPMPPNCPKRCELSDVLVRIFRLATVALCLEMRCLHKCSKHHEGSTSNLIETQIYLRILNWHTKTQGMEKNDWTYRYLSIYLPTYLSTNPPTYLPIYQCIYLFLYLSLFFSPSLSIYLPTYLAIYLSIYLFIYLSIYLCFQFIYFYLCIYVSKYLRI
jgi:hypothetical protein